MQKVVGVEKLCIECNSFDFANPIFGLDPPVAVQLIADSSAAIPPDFVFGDVIIRDNYARYLEDDFALVILGYGFDVQGARNLIVRDNMIESSLPVPVKFSMCGRISYFDNRNPDGELIPFVDPVTGKEKEEYETPAEGALVLACFYNH